MEEKTKYLVSGNTGLESIRITGRFKAFANSPYVGKLRAEKMKLAL